MNIWTSETGANIHFFNIYINHSYYYGIMMQDHGSCFCHIGIDGNGTFRKIKEQALFWLSFFMDIRITTAAVSAKK